MADRVEEFLQIQVDGIFVARVDVGLRFTQGIMTTASGAEAVVAFAELRLVERGKDLGCGLAPPSL